MEEKTSQEQGTPQQKRQIAYKVLIESIIDAPFIKQEGWNPNYIQLPDGTKVSRVNVIGTVIDKEEVDFPTITIDDGSRNIMVRSFDNAADLKPYEIGETVLIVGRPREYNQQRYILPEIIKTVDVQWLRVRKLELEKGEGQKADTPSTVEVYQEESVEQDQSQEPDIFKTIRELDEGEGANIEDIISKIGPEVEKQINNLLKAGEIFENKPGRVKVLE